MKPTFFLLATLSALVAAAPVHASTTLRPLSIHRLVSGASSGQMVDNMLPNSDLPGGGIASSSSAVDKRALANAAPDTFDSSTYYDAAAEKEAEELALVLDTASENVAEDESAGDNDVKVERKRGSGSGSGNRRRRAAGACRKFTPAKCEDCQREWEMHQACLCEKKGSSVDACVQGKRQNYDVCAKKECS